MFAPLANLAYFTTLVVLFYIANIVDSLAQMKPRESDPVILNKPEEYVVGAGSNITISCSAYGTQPLNIVWFQDEKTNQVSNYTRSNPSDHEWISNTAPSTSTTMPDSHQGPKESNQKDSATTTKLLEERRYRIEEELTAPNVTTSRLYLIDLRPTDSGVFLCWVENAVSYQIRNFTLTVNDSPSLLMAIPATGTVVIIILVISLLVTSLFCLILLRHLTSGSDRKSDLKSDLKSRELSLQETSSNKSQILNHGHIFVPSDDELEEQNNMRVLSDAELDGFIEYMRTGIINMDYHSISPVAQFNNK